MTLADSPDKTRQDKTGTGFCGVKGQRANCRFEREEKDDSAHSVSEQCVNPLSICSSLHTPADEVGRKDSYCEQSS